MLADISWSILVIVNGSNLLSRKNMQVPGDEKCFEASEKLCSVRDRKTSHQDAYFETLKSITKAQRNSAKKVTNPKGSNSSILGNVFFSWETYVIPPWILT